MRTRSRLSRSLAILLALAALGLAACSGDGAPLTTATASVASTTTVAATPETCDEVTGLLVVSTVLATAEGRCAEWVDQSIGRAALGSTGSASVWSRHTRHGTALIVGAVHTLGQGWFGPASTAVVETMVDPSEQTGVPRLFLVSQDNSGPDELASPWFRFYNASIAAARNNNRMQDVLPREDFYVAVTDPQKLDVSGLPPVPDPLVPEPVPLYDPLDATVTAPTFATAQDGVLVLLLGYPNATRELTASVGRVLSDEEAFSAVAMLADFGDSEGSIPYEAEVEVIIVGAAAPGMSGGPVVDEQGRLIGMMVRATESHDGVQYVRAVRMTYVASRLAATFASLPAETQLAVQAYLER